MAMLRARYPDWTITFHGTYRAWFAERAEGGQIRVLVAVDAVRLAAKIEAAEAEK